MGWIDRLLAMYVERQRAAVSEDGKCKQDDEQTTRHTVRWLMQSLSNLCRVVAAVKWRFGCLLECRQSVQDIENDHAVHWRQLMIAAGEDQIGASGQRWHLVHVLAERRYHAVTMAAHDGEVEDIRMRLPVEPAEHVPGRWWQQVDQYAA